MSRKARARDLGLPFPGRTGPWNAITDVPGLEVGFTTLVEGDGAKAVRTGVTAILPRGGASAAGAVWAGAHSFNGNGEMTGLHWVAEAGWLRGPILLTNTHSVGMAHHAAVGWIRKISARPGDFGWVLPIVAETCDNWLNAMDRRAISEPHVLAALEGASSGPVPEGNVGGGTGMIAYEFKGGTGTASRELEPLAPQARSLRLGVLVQANFGLRPNLTVLGVPVGRLMRDGAIFTRDQGSIIGILATDAPLHPLQLQRVARRMVLGMARTGTYGGNGSGDIFLAISTAGDPLQSGQRGVAVLDYIPDDNLDPLFAAAAEATEEAILNALVAADTMSGRDGRTAQAIDGPVMAELVLRYLDRLHGV
ncbi:DmpA family aminopeptidase [Alsobacter sp. SYSU BS001988]